jgi:hypothetical protein
MVVLSLGLHLEILLLFLLVLPQLQKDTAEQTPAGKGSPPSIAMVMEVGTAEGVKLPAPSYAPTKVAPGDAPSMAPPPPMPQPAPLGRQYRAERAGRSADRSSPASGRPTTRARAYAGANLRHAAGADHRG